MITLLLVEDDPAVWAALVLALPEGYALLPTATAAGALRILATVPVDLVVLGPGVPDLGAGDALRMIRGASAAPIIVTTQE